jgi:hypothetical protein
VQDWEYLRALIDQGAAAPLPPDRRTKAQQKIHAENVERVTSASSG